MTRASAGDEGQRLLVLAGLFERLPTAVAYLTGPEHRFELANEAYRRLVGRDDLLGRTLREALPELEGQGYFEKLDEVLAGGGPVQGRESEIWLQAADGGLEQVFVDFLYEPVRGSDGSVVGVLVDAEDVTSHVLDRRRLEHLTEELAGAQERYRTLFDTMLVGVVYHDAEGVIVAANPAAGSTLGVDVKSLIGQHPLGPGWRAVREDGTPFPGEEHPAMVALRTGEVVPEVVMGVAHGGTRERRWLLVTAVPDVRDEHGRPQRVYAMFQDVTAQRRAASMLRERDTLLGRLRDANVLGVLVADAERVLDSNDAFLDMVGYDQDDLAGGRIDWRAITPPEWAHRDDLALEQLRSTGSCVPFEKELVHASGRRVQVMLGATVVNKEPLRWVTFVTDLSARHRAEEERLALVALAQAARAEATSAGERLSLLLRAGAFVAASGERQDLLLHLTRLVVPAMADCATVFLPTEDGALRAAASEHRTPQGTLVLEALADRLVTPRSGLGLDAAFRTGSRQVTRDLADCLAGSEDADPAYRDAMLRLDVDSLVAVPLRRGSGVLGVLLLGRDTTRPPFTESDVAVGEELGRRLAVGLATADAFAREHTVAEMLQRSVLPDDLPEVPGADLAVVYLPATEGVDVGGDWYDAFSLGPGRIGIVLGDVVGHNLASASAMSQVRNALRAYAVADPEPATVLRRTNAALGLLMPEAMATVVYGVLDVGRRELRFANAGHPPPLLTGAGSATYLDDVGGLMLGVAEDTTYTEGSRGLPAGAALVLYSDGLVEDRGQSIDKGLATLAEALSGRRFSSAAEVCEAAQMTLGDSPTRSDDVCLLAVRLAG